MLAGRDDPPGEAPPGVFSGPSGHVYPMRLSRLAREPQSLGLYVVAPHRMEPRGRIDGDHELRAADADTPYRRVVYGNELLTVAGVPVWLLAVGTVLAAALTAVLLLMRVRSRRLRGRSASQAPLPLP